MPPSPEPMPTLPQWKPPWICYWLINAWLGTATGFVRGRYGSERGREFNKSHPGITVIKSTFVFPSIRNFHFQFWRLSSLVSYSNRDEFLYLHRKGALSLFVARHNSFLKPLPVLYNHIVNNLPTEDTSPSPKMFLTAEELFVSHGSTAATARHYMNPTTKLLGSLSGWICEVKKNLKS